MLMRNQAGTNLVSPSLVKSCTRLPFCGLCPGASHQLINSLKTKQKTNTTNNVCNLDVWLICIFYTYIIMYLIYKYMTQIVVFYSIEGPGDDL